MSSAGAILSQSASRLKYRALGRAQQYPCGFPSLGVLAGFLRDRGIFYTPVEPRELLILLPNGSGPDDGFLPLLCREGVAVV